MSPQSARSRSAVDPFCRAVVLTLAVAGRIDAAPFQAAGSAAPPRATFDLDLTLPKTTVLAVPSGTYLDIGLRNAVPSALYRISIGTRGLPANRFELPKPVGAIESYAKVSGCADLTREALAVLSLAEEPEIATRVAAFEQSAARSSCGLAKPLLQQTVMQTRPSLRYVYQLTPDQELVVTVERVSRDSNQVLKSWTATFRAGAPDVGWRFPTEQAWVVHDVAEAIADMAFFAGHHGVPSPADVDVAVEAFPQPGVTAPRFQVRLRPGATPQTVTAQPHVWVPASYDALARSLLSSLKPSPAPASSPVLEALTDLRGVVIEAESRRVSDRVTAYPLDAASHEQAALVAGALGLREAAGIYADLRPTLNRMAAHLAFARAVRAEASPGPDGRLADIVLSTLVGRQREALAALESLKAGRPSKAESAWIDALMTRNEGDWKRIKRPASSTLLERIEYFRAASRGAGVAAALVALGPRLEPVADWGRDVLQRSFSVGEGHQFVPPSISMELAELQAVWSVGHPGVAPPERPAALLDANSGRTVAIQEGRARIQVLDPGDWSAFFRRHTFQAADRGEEFFNRMLDLKEQGEKWVAAADEAFAALSGHAFVSLGPAIPELNADGPFAALCGRAATMARKAPQQVSPASWSMAARKCGGSIPAPTGWLSPLIPAETAFEAQRFMLPEFLGLSAAELDRMRWTAPFEPLLRRRFLARGDTGQPPTKEVPRPQTAGPGHEMATLAQELAAQKDPAMRRKTAQRMCDLSADRCLALGSVLVEQGREAEAAAAYERAVARAQDRVAVANQVGWLVDYHFRKGDKVKAEQVARMAAEVYSERGLLIMADLMDRMGRYAAAEDYYRRIKERYQDEAALKHFYVRYRHDVAGPLFAAESEAAMKEVFPAGLERAKLADFSLAPSAGVSVVTSPDVQKLTGLDQGDVIVAMDGYRVKTYEQYVVIRGFRAAGKKPLLVWHQGAYVEMPDTPLPQPGLIFMTLGARTWIGPKPAQGPQGKPPEYWLKALREATPADQAFLPAAFAAMGEDAVPGLLGLLKDPDVRVQQRAADAFRFMLPPPASAAPGLVEALKTASPMAKGPILSALGKMGPVHADVIPAVVAALDDPAFSTWAAAALGDMGPAARGAIPALERARDRAPAASRNYYDNALQRIRPK
jgi:tetratricopeptide (TPR) repeat protein